MKRELTPEEMKQAVDACDLMIQENFTDDGLSDATEIANEAGICGEGFMVGYKAALQSSISIEVVNKMAEALKGATDLLGDYLCDMNFLAANSDAPTQYLDKAAFISQVLTEYQSLLNTPTNGQ
jgi:hypothetical protein